MSPSRSVYDFVSKELVELSHAQVKKKDEERHKKAKDLQDVEESSRASRLSALTAILDRGSVRNKDIKEALRIMASLLVDGVSYDLREDEDEKKD